MRRSRYIEPEKAQLVSTIRRILGRPKRPSVTLRAALFALLRFAVLLPFLLAVGIVSAWWFGAMKAALTEPGETFQLQRTFFKLSPGQSVEIGRAHLMQRRGRDSAELRHVRFEQTTSGDLRLSNIAKERRLGLLSEGQEINAASADRIELTGPPGQTTRVVIDGRNVVFRDVSGRGFEIEIEGNGRFKVAIGLGWNEVRRIGRDGTTTEALETCAMPGWRDDLQTRLTWIGLLFKRPLNQSIVTVGGPDTCQVGRAFALALPRPDNVSELVVSMTTDDRLGRSRRVFLAPLSGRTRNIVTVERYPMGCEVGNASCRSATQSGLNGTSWLIARPLPIRSPEPTLGNAGPPSATWLETPIRRFIAGRTTYSIDVSFGDGKASVPNVTVTLRPLSVIHQFPRDECGWFLASNGLPPASQTDDEGSVCPQRAQNDGPAVTVVPTNDHQTTFDRQLATRPLDRYERASRLAILVFAVAVALWLAVPGSSARPRHWSTASIGRLRQIWPVLITVVLAAVPDLLQSLNVRVGATTAFALTIGNWAIAGFVLAFVPRTGRRLALMWAVLTGLAAIGSVSLASLSDDIGTTHAASYLVKHKLVFLDLLPPLALAIVTARLTVLRPLLASIVLDNRARYAAVRWLPPFAMISLFVCWLTIGTQQGLGGLQPVEGGKFCFVIIVGAILVSFERASRAEALSATSWSRAVAVAIVVVFISAIYLVPFLRNDYSPLLIVSATGAVLVLFRFLPDVWRWIVTLVDMLSERVHLPMRLRPRVYEPFIPFLMPRVWRGTKFVAGISLVVTGFAAAALAIVFFGAPLLAFALNLDRMEWPTGRNDRMQILERSLGIGRRVPIERVLTWIDLDYDTPGTPQVRYRDVGFHVIRSRVEMESAHCEMSAMMRGVPILPGVTFPNRVIEELARRASRFFGFDLNPTGPLCLSRAPPDTTDALSATAILSARGAHTIPVAESDFAAAYLIARHGVASAALLFSFQFAFFVLALVAYLRLARVRGSDASDAVVQYLLSILLAGTTSLFVIQWFLAWSNSLGLLPVMGQPMTWLSAGTSHHLLMALPGAVTVLLAIRYTVATRAGRSRRSPPL